MRICRLALVFCNDGAVDYSQSPYISQLGCHQTQFHPTIMWSINRFVHFSQKPIESQKAELLRFLHYFLDLACKASKKPKKRKETTSATRSLIFTFENIKIIDEV